MTFEVENNFRGRARLILAAHDEYYDNIHKDAIVYLQRKLLERVIGGQYVGVISGNLRRSQIVNFGRYISEMRPNFTIAPYARYVADWAFSKYGANYYGILLRLFGKDTYNRMKAEFRRMLKFLNKGQAYQYKNPFPG